MARLLYLGVRMMWIGVLVFLYLDLWVSADEMGRPTTSWWDSDMHIKNNSNQKSWMHIFRKYCGSTQIKDCDGGHYRERSGPYKGRCVPCNCNGLSNDCDPHTGKCLNCQFNTAGDHCERCLEGYYGNAVLRTCRLCPCPLADSSNSFAVGCIRTGDEFECLCKPGYSGVRCERCALGFYGNPLAERGSCQPCDCNHGYGCDPLTGDCYEADDPDTGNCLDCDICVSKLMDDLEAMDDEFSTLLNQLQSFRDNATLHKGLERLERAITGTKVLVHRYTESISTLTPKIVELEFDLERVKDDLTVLNDKAIEIACASVKLLKSLDETYQRGDNLRSESLNLLRRIQELLEELRGSNNMGGDTEEATRMINEAQWMLEKMRRQSCRVQRELANEELRKAQKLLNHILKEVIVPLNGTLDVANPIGQSLMDRAEDLRDIQEALVDAQLDVMKASSVNKLNEEQLKNILKQIKSLKKNQRSIVANAEMTKSTLNEILDVHKIMDDLKEDLACMAAPIDGAKNSLEEKLKLLSNATANEGIVRHAEDHAEELMKQAMDFQWVIMSITNSSAVQKAIEAIRAFIAITDAIKLAEDAAKRAKEAADQAFKDVQGQDLHNKAKDLKDSADALVVKAKEAEKQLEDITQKCEDYKNLIKMSKVKHNELKRVMRDVLERMKNITTDDIQVLINQAKESSSNVNTTASDAITKMQILSEELNNMNISPQDPNLDNLLDGVNKTLTELDQSFPSLIDKLNDVENQSKHLPAPINMSSSIQRIKVLIEQTRDAANRIRGPILFSGDAHIELRPPKDLEDFRTFTSINLTLHQPKARGDARRRRQLGDEDDHFVLYFGNKHKVRDFIGLVVRDRVLFCIYKLGGHIHELETSEITQSTNSNAFMDRVDFRRVYQDAEVIYTQTFTSTEPKELPPMISQPQTRNGLLDLDPNEVVLYVGGYPSNFTPPTELQYPGFKGCIEFTSLNDHILGLYNFQRAVNITKNDLCKRGKVRTSGYYFDGTGYGKADISNWNTLIKFSVLSHQIDAVLFYMGDENSYLFVTLEEGYIVLRGVINETAIFEKSMEKVFPKANFYHIRLILKKGQTLVAVTEYANIYLGDIKGHFTEAYIGGVPAAVQEKYNIVLPSIRGCFDKVDIHGTVTFREEVGIVRGCPNRLLGSRKATFQFGSSLSVAPNVTDTGSGTMVSLGFKTSQENIPVLLMTAGMNNDFLLSLKDGFVEMSDSKEKLTSTNKCETGKWHYITGYRSSAGMQLNVDNIDIVHPPSSSAFPEFGANVTLGEGLFEGCVRNLYIRSLQTDYIPADLSSFSQTGNVSLGFCKAELPRLDITKKRARHAGFTFSSNSESHKHDCRNPKSLKNTYHLGSSSQMQFTIDPEVLNNRPHFSLDVQTTSSEGLLLHVSGKYGVPLVILYLDNGKVKLSVGEDEIISSEKIDDGDWHNVKFSIKKIFFHLAVDGIQTPDEQPLKGFTHDLQSLVYVGRGQLQETYGKVPQKSIIGCIRDLKVSKVTLVNPAVNHGATPCFKGPTEKGAYFAGNGSHLFLEKHFMFGPSYNLAFEFQPRNLTGLVFHRKDNSGQTLTLFLRKGKVILKVKDGLHRYSTEVTPTQTLCGAFHSVSVSVGRKTIKLKVGDTASHVRRHPVSQTSFHENIYIGGISENWKQAVEMRTSFVGCLRNVQINQKPLTFDNMSVFGPINTNDCPVK